MNSKLPTYDEATSPRGSKKKDSPQSISGISDVTINSSRGESNSPPSLRLPGVVPFGSLRTTPSASSTPRNPRGIETPRSDRTNRGNQSRHGSGSRSNSSRTPLTQSGSGSGSPSSLPPMISGFGGDTSSQNSGRYTQKTKYLIFFFMFIFFGSVFTVTAINVDPLRRVARNRYITVPLTNPFSFEISTVTINQSEGVLDITGKVSLSKETKSETMVEHYFSDADALQRQQELLRERSLEVYLVKGDPIYKTQKELDYLLNSTLSDITGVSIGIYLFCSLGIFCCTPAILFQKECSSLFQKLRRMVR